MQLYLRRMKTIHKVLLLVLCSQSVQAQQLRFGMQPIEYISVNAGPYIDFYSTLDASTIAFEMDKDSVWHSRFKVAISFEGKVDVVQYEYSSKDSASSAPLMLQKSTFTIVGDYREQRKPMEIFLYDEISGDEWKFNDTLDYEAKDFLLSQPLLLDEVESAPKEYTKRGVPVIPVASLGIPVYENKQFISVYSEAFARKGKYLVQYKFTDARGQMVPGTSGFARCTQGSTPLYTKVDFSRQSSGQYEFTATALDSTGEQVFERSAPFYWYNDEVDNRRWNGPEISITRAVFESGWGKWNRVNDYLRMIAPVTSLAERRVLTNLKDTEDTARIAQFIVNFWSDKNPADALGEWKGYQQVVEKVDQEFGTRTVPGYMSHMGRVFLQYGAPSLVEARPYDGRNYPYQVWQYDQLKSSSTPVQQNQVFIFVDQELIGRQYTLIHSSAMGEVKDHKWQFHLTRHTNAGSDIDATSTQYSRDNFGERISNSLIIGNQGTWFDRFNF